MSKEIIRLSHVPEPKRDWSGKSITLSDDTIKERVNKVISRMKSKDLKQLVIYADVEHGGNFEYLVGFFPRFEEAVLIVDVTGEMQLLLGNENLNKVSKARINASAIHISQFSLPNQPQRHDYSFLELMKQSLLSDEGKIGLVGWKNFTGILDDNHNTFDIPSFIVEAVRTVNPNITNATELFIGLDGARRTHNANEIAYFEFGASLASDAMLDALNAIEVDISEMEVANMLTRNGQHTNVVTIMASGDRFVKANMYPTHNTLKLGDPVSITIGYRGGLSSRAGFIVEDETQLPKNQLDYINRVAAPYFNAYTHWLEYIGLNIEGGRLYQEIESVLPKEQYGWSLCPGHLASYEEWSSSPVYDGSTETLQSGMLFQVDIIPSVPGYAGVSAESTVVLADATLKAQIKEEYPEMWQRMQQRLYYMRHVLGIQVSDAVLPMCSTVGYLRPFLLDKNCAFVKEENERIYDIKG